MIPATPLLRNRRFAFLYASDTISAFGDRIHALALYILVYDLTGRTLDLGMLAMAQLVPGTLVAPVSGWLVDRVDRRRMMVYMDLVRGGLVLLLPWVETLPQILAIGLVLAVAEEFHTPARLAILPEMVGKERVVPANSLTLGTGHLLLIVGPALGGVLIATFGTTVAFQINAATYGLSALLLFGIGGFPAPVREAMATGRDLARQFVAEVKEGAGVVLGDPPLRFALGFFALVTLVASLQQPITLVFVKDVLGAGDDGLGWIIASAGLGGILGGILAAVTRDRIPPLRAITVACALDGAALLGFSTVRVLPAAMALFLVFGLMGAVIQVRVISLFQTRVPEEARGRAFGWLGPVFGPISIASIALGTILADRFGVVVVMAVSGGLQFLVGAACFLWMTGRPVLSHARDGGAVAGALALLLVAGCGSTPDARPPDLVLISLDTLRADHLGSYGAEREVSPFLDRLAEEGTRFADAWAPSPWTLPSHATLLTGRHTFEHGAIEDGHGIDRRAAMLPEVLRAAGYRTGAAVTSVYVSSRYGMDRGFDHFHDFGIVDGTLATQTTLDAEEVLDHGLAWASDQPDDAPVFLFLHLYDIHYPYDPPAPWNERLDPPARPEILSYENYFHYLRNPLDEATYAHLRNQYDEEILYVDDALRRFHAAWSTRRPDTVFAVVSDHGEEFGERGSWGHAHTLTPEQLHIPWILHGPGVEAQVVEARAGLEDVAPTLAGLAGVGFPASGLDRSAQVGGGAAPPGDAARFASTSRFRTLKHRWHDPPLDLVVDLARSQAVLYDLARDPRATTDLSGSRRDDALRLMAGLYAWRGEPWELRAAATLETDGVIVVGGAPQGSRVEAPAGIRFAVYPLDAAVRATTAAGVVSGPWAVLGGTTPDATDPLLGWEGRPLESIPADLSPEDRERLRSLGYID